MKILIVDDDAEEVKRLQSLVEECGHQVYTASTGARALAVLAAEQPDWMILDTGLPDMSGLDVFRQIRLNPHTRQTVVLLANPDPKDEEVIFGFGYCSDFHWQHPVDADTLKRVLVRFALSDAEYDAKNLDVTADEAQTPRFVDDTWSQSWDAEAKRSEPYSLEKALDAIRRHSNAPP